MTTFTLQTNSKTPTLIKPVMLVLLCLVLVDIGLRCVEIVRKSPTVSSANKTELSARTPSVKHGESVAGITLSPTMDKDTLSELPELDHSQVAIAKIDQANDSTLNKLSRYHELPWHFSSLLESLNGIMMSDSASLGIYVAEAELIEVELFQRVSLRAVFQRWSELSVTELIGFINSGTDFNNSQFNQLIIDEVTETLVHIAQQEGNHEEMLNQLMTGRSPFQIVSAMLATWSSSDPASALSWLDQNNRDGVLDEHLPIILQALIDSDPAKALERIHQLPDAEQKTYLAQIEQTDSVVTVAVNSPQQAIEMLTDLPYKQREARQEEILMQWFSEDAATAANWIANSQDPTMLASLENMIADLPRIDLVAAQDVFPTLQASLQQQLVEGIARESALQDESATQAWVESLDNNAHRFLAESSILQVAIEKDPNRALEMASDYSGDNRMEFLQIAVTGVQRNKPELITPWFTSAALTEDERIHLQSVITQVN